MQHWSDYWRNSGALNSFAESGAASGYAGEIAEFWQQHLSKCAKDACVVDAGTGNGALAVLITEYGEKHKRAWEVIGVDAAAINPEASLQGKPELQKKLQGISFHGETPIEKMPFADGSIDCVTSQFAFEYADTKPALQEIFRVLKPGGELVVMAHHSESALVQDSQRGLQIFDYILNNSPLFMQLDLLFNLASGALDNMDYTSWNRTQECIAVTKSVQWTMTIINERFNQAGDGEWVNDVFGQAIGLIKSVQDAQTAKQALQGLGGVYNALQNHVLRIQEQVSVALNKEKLMALQSIVEDLQGEFSYADFTIEDELFAYTFTAKKR
ncbi:class I SAM-dependent methyltransferase [Aliidiomarina sp.]|uniref:class I SAM-dependent methyltransferase n=1 Tax=Aliidiomarina sp. TaxID=1872439 RepID=UPI003A4DD056